MDILLNQLIQFYLNNTINLRHLTRRINPRHYVVLYPQNGDRIVTIDSVTSLHPMYFLKRERRAKTCHEHTGTLIVTHVPTYRGAKLLSFIDVGRCYTSALEHVRAPNDGLALLVNF